MIKFNKRGFALLEVLISMVVLGIALNGVGQFWNKTVRESEHNYARSQAIVVARNIIESFRANSMSQASLDVYINEANWIPGTATLANYTACADAQCTPEQMALADIYMANEYARTSLPLGEGQALIQSPCAEIAGNESRCVIVSWDSDKTPSECEPLNDGSGELDIEDVTDGAVRETAKCVVVDFI